MFSYSFPSIQRCKYTSKKGFAEDLTEGKFSFPVIHGIHADPTSSLLLSMPIFFLLCFAYFTYGADVLQKRPTMPAFKDYAISYLRSNTRSFDYTLDVLRTLERLTFVEMERLGENPLLVGIMDHVRVPDL
jgi:geranylgeranyl diphosphate synthase, type III